MSSLLGENSVSYQCTWLQIRQFDRQENRTIPHFLILLCRSREYTCTNKETKWLTSENWPSTCSMLCNNAVINQKVWKKKLDLTIKGYLLHVWGQILLFETQDDSMPFIMFIHYKFEVTWIW